MRFKTRKKDKHCIKITPCGRDPTIKCEDCISYKDNPLEWIKKYKL